MVSLIDLWLPILVSAVIVFVASFLAWMVLPHHKADWKGIPNEDKFLDLVRDGIKPGQYMYPFCGNHADMKDPEKKKRWAAGPHGTLNVWSGAPNMGKNLVLTFIFYLVVGVFVGYITGLGRPAGAAYMEVHRMAGAVAVAAYCLAAIPHSIWFGRPARALVMDLIDGVIYGLLTGGVFGWLWPDVASQIPALPGS